LQPSTRSHYQSHISIHQSRLYESCQTRERDRTLGPVRRTANLSRCAKSPNSRIQPNYHLWIEYSEKPFKVTRAQRMQKRIHHFALPVKIR
jgi:hypothetical protein